MDPEEVSSEVMTANLLGRGGAGFEAGSKWSMLAKARPAYLVINGDESEPCTFKDHMLIEDDPHQIIEGTLICAYATGAAQAFIFVRGEFALGLERMTAALNEAYAYGAVGPRHLRLRLLGRRGHPPRRRRLHLRRGDGPAREPGGQAGLPPRQAALLPGGHGPLHAAHHRQQRRDACPTCRGSCSTAATPSPPWARDAPPAPASSRSRAT